MHGNTGKTELSVKCGADGKFLDTAVCEAVQCGSPSFPNVTVLETCTSGKVTLIL